MSDVQVKDFDDFKSPGRKPWLLLILLVVVAVVMVKVLTSVDKPEEPPETATPESEVVTQAPETLSTSEPDMPVESSGTVQESVETDLDVNAALAEAKQREAEKDLVRAQALYARILRAPLTPKMRAEIEKRAGEIGIELVMNPQLTQRKVEYVVQSGDSVARIAKKFGTTVELVKKSNHIANPNVIRAGDRFVILNQPFSIQVSKKRNDLLLLLNGRFFKRYLVGTGKYGKTPVGTFELTEKQPEPVWWKDGKAIPYTGDSEGQNILGTRWMTLKATGETAPVKGYGIHGTWDESSIGKPESAGCVRMRNREVEELYILVPTGTPVTIVE